MTKPLISKAYDTVFSQQPNITLSRELDRVCDEIGRRDMRSREYWQNDPEIANLQANRALLEHYLNEHGETGTMPEHGEAWAHDIYERNKHNNIITYGLIALPTLSLGGLATLIATPFQTSDVKAIACAAAGTISSLAAAALFDQMRKLSKEAR